MTELEQTAEQMVHIKQLQKDISRLFKMHKELQEQIQIQANEENAEYHHVREEKSRYTLDHQVREETSRYTLDQVNERITSLEAILLHGTSVI